MIRPLQITTNYRQNEIQNVSALLANGQAIFELLKAGELARRSQTRTAGRAGANCQ
jgi:hypothetical protein